MELHETQKEALQFMVDSVTSNKHIVALIGAGGTGKSEILSRFRDHYSGKRIYYSATTNKAVSRLKKDIPSTKTLHSHVSKPVYTPLYNNLEDYYAFLPDKKEKENRKQYEDSFRFLSVTKAFLAENYFDVRNFDTHLDIINKLGKTSFDEPFFDRYIVKERIENSVVLIDEASMLSTKSEYNKKGSLVAIGVDTASEVFDNIILVGDSSQLPPINGKSSFDDVDSYELTENFRSEKDLLDAIQWARDGKDFEDYKPTSKNVKLKLKLSNQWYESTYGLDNVVHICYTNKTRHSIVKRVRGNRPAKPQIGEPVILRGSNTNTVCKGEIGIFEGNEIVFESGIIHYNRRWHHFDEYESEKYSIFQYAYASTCHMYQGSAADHVIIHLYDIPFFIKDEDRRKWIYTAVSRARKTITIIL